MLHDLVLLSSILKRLMETTSLSHIDCLKSKGLKFAHLNIRSLLRNIDEINSFLQSNEIHILALN